MNKYHILLKTLVFIFTLSNSSSAQTVLEAYVPKSIDVEGFNLPYRVLMPKQIDKNKKYPLVIFLHGRGESGNDNTKQLTHGAALFLKNIDKYPAFILFPQCPKDNQWTHINRTVTSSGTSITYKDDVPPTIPLNAVMHLIREYEALEYIDKDRIYITGLSMGGRGTWELLARIPEKIAAAAPICGGAHPNYASRMTNVPIWAFHGVKDDIVPAAHTIRMVEAIQKAGGSAKVTLYPDADHNSWDATFDDPDYLVWLFTKKKPTHKAANHIDILMEKMTLQEKIGQLNLLTPGGAITGEVVSKDVNQKIIDGKVGGIFGIRGAENVRQVQEIAVKKSRLGIPLLVGMDVIHGHQTIFPIPLGLSCTWDTSLIEKTARIAALEATADGIMWGFSPMVDIARDPRWGRIAEGSGEDPFLGAAIAKAMIKGYQGSDLSKATTMLACVKHYANYGASEGGRDYGSVDMSAIKSYNEYLPPYKAAVEAGVGAVMTSFNVMDYVPASANKVLLNNILRHQWGFSGLVVTDYTSINEMMEHGLGSLKEVSAQALEANVDMDMVGEGFLTTLEPSFLEGRISENQINIACRRILEAKEKLGLFDDPYKYCDNKRAETDIMTTEHLQFARNVAAQSFVLLKNDKNILPLQKKGKIAVIGPLADSRRNMLGTWSVSGDHNKAVTVLEGIKSVVGSKAEILYAKGVNISDDPEFVKRVNVFGEQIIIDKRSPNEMIEEAVRVGKKADVIIAVVGEAADMSGEASSMANIGLQPNQVKLLAALKKLNKPIIMVLYNGRPMTLAWENDNMDAILNVWFGGTEGGNAVADVIFGDVNPSGKLTTSFPIHIGQIPVYHSMLNTGRPDPGNRSKFRSNYLDIPNEPLYPFGYGLSYTSFNYSNLRINKTEMRRTDTLLVSVEVKNTGNRHGKEVVQLYIRDVVASISRPVKELKGFVKIELDAGESTTVTFPISQELLKFYNSKLNLVAEDGIFEVMVGPDSEHTQKVSFELK